MKNSLSIIAVLLGLSGGLFGGGAAARAEIDLFKPLNWGMSIESVRKYYNLIGPTDIGGNVNVYASPDNPFGDLYGDLFFNFHAGRLIQFHMFLGEKDTGNRFRSVLRVMNGASAWTQIFLKAGTIEIPLLVKPVIDPFKPPPPPPTSFDEAKSVWIESQISDEAVFIYKQKRSYREFMRVVTAKSDSLRGVVINLHKGFVSATFVPARDLVPELDQTGEDAAAAQSQDPENKTLDLLKPLAPK